MHQMRGHRVRVRARVSHSALVKKSEREKGASCPGAGVVSVVSVMATASRLWPVATRQHGTRAEEEKVTLQLQQWKGCAEARVTGKTF